MNAFGTLSALVLILPGIGALGAQAAPAAPATPLGIERTVPVAARALPRGATLSRADFSILPTVVRPALKDAAAADSGWVTRRPVVAGEPLVEPAVGPPALVTSGQLVSFVAEAEGIRLSIRGTAATAGSLGDRVWVRVESGRRLRGVVTAPATVSADTTFLR
jgi:flagella basal body P-ring formation protein FlgA